METLTSDCQPSSTSGFIVDNVEKYLFVFNTNDYIKSTNGPNINDAATERKIKIYNKSTSNWLFTVEGPDYEFCFDTVSCSGYVSFPEISSWKASSVLEYVDSGKRKTFTCDILYDSDKSCTVTANSIYNLGKWEDGTCVVYEGWGKYRECTEDEQYSDCVIL